jgi:hypothetical protein
MQEDNSALQPAQSTQVVQQPVAQVTANIPHRIVSESIVMEVRNSAHDIQTKVAVPQPDKKQ